ncbi:melanopsin-like [Montipora foliosa]|uniref:melanopsin-like n=1 Tax=Montipora foliosa TaxID=591990 RepID=UPI0035F1B6E3
MVDRTLDESASERILQLANKSSSTTSYNKAPLPHGSIAIIQLLVLFLTLTVGFIGNASLVAVVIRNRQMRTRTNMFLTQLAVTGMGVCLFSIPFMITALIKQSWVLGEVLCKLNAFFVPFCFSSSIFTLTAICIHKYFSVVKPLRRIITHKRTLLIIGFIWLSAFACSIGPIFGWTVIIFRSSASMCCPRDPQNTLEISHTIFMLCVVYMFPILAMVFLYLRIIIAVKSHCQRIRDTAIIDDRGILAQRKIIITLLYVLTAFVVCWTPYFIYGIMSMVTRPTNFPPYFLGTAYICGFLYSVCTPIILCTRNPRFRRGFKELVTFQGINRPSLGAHGSIPHNCGSSRRPSSDYLTERRCSVWFLSSQNSLLSIEPEPCYRRRRLRWIETYL